MFPPKISGSQLFDRPNRPVSSCDLAETLDRQVKMILHMEISWNLAGWWFGTWFLWLSIQLGMSSSQLTLTPLFFRGVGSIPPTSWRIPWHPMIFCDLRNIWFSAFFEAKWWNIPVWDDAKWCYMMVDCWGGLLHLPHLPHPKFHPILEVDKLFVSIWRYTSLCRYWLIESRVSLQLWCLRNQITASVIKCPIEMISHTRCFTLVMFVGLYYHH